MGLYRRGLPTTVLKYTKLYPFSQEHHFQEIPFKNKNTSTNKNVHSEAPLFVN